MVVVETKGDVPGCVEAKEVWLWGCQSLVAILRGKGRVRRWLIVGIMARALGTARVPFWGGDVSWIWLGWVGEVVRG